MMGRLPVPGIMVKTGTIMMPRLRRHRRPAVVSAELLMLTSTALMTAGLLMLAAALMTAIGRVEKGAERSQNPDLLT